MPGCTGPTQFGHEIDFFSFFFERKFCRETPLLFFCLSQTEGGVGGLQPLSGCREHAVDWLYNREIIVPFLTHSGGCTGAKSSAFCTRPSPRCRSHPLQNVPHAVSSHLYRRIIFCGINFNSPLIDECQVSSQPWDFSRWQNAAF